MLPRFEVFDEVIGKAKIRKHKFVTKLIKTLNANERHKFTDTNWLPTFRDKKFSIRGLFPKKKWTMERILKHNPHLAQVCEFYDQLSDDQSRDLLVRLSAYKILGGGKVRLPLYNKKIWKENFHDLEKICTPANDGRTSVIGDFGFYDLKKYGYDLNLYYNKLGTMLTFMLQQYKYKDICAVRPGDVVIDGGACYGDTALYFADKAGKGGKVYAWEFVDDNISVMNKNMELNSHLKNIIEIVRRPMGRNSTDELYASGVGPGSRLDDKPARGGVKHTTLSIDDFAKENDLEKLDFIKMDIEGAEADSIRGAARTIAKFKPNLAICIYHKADDYAVIPKLIKEINPDYEFYIGHFTVQGWETVLYAVDRNRGKK
jgi:FkbM family methyltransferase